jgi:hypothetical protein
MFVDNQKPQLNILIRFLQSLRVILIGVNHSFLESKAEQL